MLQPIRMTFAQLLEKVVNYIQNHQTTREKAGKSIRHAFTQNGSPSPPEGQISYKINPLMLQGSIAGVDSGFISQSYYAMDLLLIHAHAVCFTYEKGKVVQTRYLPESFPLPEPIVNEQGLERDEFHKFVSLTRMQHEMKLGKEIIEKFKPEYLFIDGSLIPLNGDKPSNESKLRGDYAKTIEAFVQLYESAEKNNCTLIGTIEDCRSERLKELLKERMRLQNDVPIEGIDLLQDAPLMDKALNAGERSMAFTFTNDVRKHSILMDFPQKWAEKLHACYVKPSQWDYPIRSEFLSASNELTLNADKIAQLVHAQSCLHKEYAFPSVLIEADLRAKLKPEEVEMVSDKIFSKIGRHSIHFRRRDRRPF